MFVLIPCMPAIQGLQDPKFDRMHVWAKFDLGCGTMKSMNRGFDHTLLERTDVREMLILILIACTQALS